jgi:hypothetical protein
MEIDDVGRGREVEVARIRELFRVAIPGNEVRNEKRMSCVGLLHEVCTIEVKICDSNTILI